MSWPYAGKSPWSVPGPMYGASGTGYIRYLDNRSSAIQGSKVVVDGSEELVLVLREQSSLLSIIFIA